MEKYPAWKLTYKAKKGMITLFLLIALIMIITSFITTQTAYSKSWLTDYQRLVEEDTYLKERNKKTYPQKKWKKNNKSFKNRPVKLFHFDPNKLDVKGYEQIGFSKKQAEIIIKFRTKMGGFRNLDDFKKCFVVSPVKAMKLAPYMHFAGDIQKTSKEYDYAEKIELNQATAEDLEKLYGIGKVLSKRIIEYRARLGGFYELGQILEVYGVNDSILYHNHGRISVDSTQIIPITIHPQSLQTYIKHPYLSPHNSKKLQEFLQSNPTLGLEYWLNYGLITRKEYEKLKHYIKME